jgi:predicted MFS family arabinose efflux permease
MSQHTTGVEKFNKYQIITIVILALTQFTVVLDFMVMSPLGDMLMKSMGLTTTQFGFAVSSYAFSAAISGFLTAGFADKFDRKKLLLFFYIGFIIGTLMCSLATNYSMLITARIVTGLFGGVIGSISLAIVADLFPIQKRGRVMGYLQMGFGASQVLGIPISLYIANSFNWEAPFMMIVIFASLIWLIIAWKLQPINKHLTIKTDKNAFLHLWHTIARKEYRVGFLTTALLSLGGFMMMPWGSAFAINNLKVSPTQLPIMFMVGGVSSLVIMPLIGRLSDRFEKLKVFTYASIWMATVVIIYTNLSVVPFYFILFMNVVMMIGILSRMVPAMALVSALPEMQDRGAFMSINSSLQQFAGGIAAAIGGMIVVQQTKTSPLENFNLLGYVILVLLAVNILMVYRLSKIVKVKIAKSTENVNA